MKKLLQVGFNGYKKLQNFRLVPESPRNLCCICVGKCIDGLNSFIRPGSGVPPLEILNKSLIISTHLTKLVVINAFAKVSQKLKSLVFLLLGLFLASIMFCFASKSYRHVIIGQTIDHSGTNPVSNLDVNSGANSDMHVNQTVL